MDEIKNICTKRIEEGVVPKIFDSEIPLIIKKSATNLIEDDEVIPVYNTLLEFAASDLGIRLDSPNSHESQIRKIYLAYKERSPSSSIDDFKSFIDQFGIRAGLEVKLDSSYDYLENQFPIYDLNSLKEVLTNQCVSQLYENLQPLLSSLSDTDSSSDFNLEGLLNEIHNVLNSARLIGDQHYNDFISGIKRICDNPGSYNRLEDFANEDIFKAFVIKKVKDEIKPQLIQVVSDYCLASLKEQSLFPEYERFCQVDDNGRPYRNIGTSSSTSLQDRTALNLIRRGFIETLKHLEEYTSSDKLERHLFNDDDFHRGVNSNITKILNADNNQRAEIFKPLLLKSLQQDSNFINEFLRQQTIVSAGLAASSEAYTTARKDFTSVAGFATSEETVNGLINYNYSRCLVDWENNGSSIERRFSQTDAGDDQSVESFKSGVTSQLKGRITKYVKQDLAYRSNFTFKYINQKSRSECDPRRR